MSGSIKMFKMRQIVRHDVPVDIPPCMYKMKNIHATKNGGALGAQDHVSSDGILKISEKHAQDIPEMALLQSRQEHILRQLAELKQMMYSLKNELKSTTEVKCSAKSSQQNSINVAQIPEIIINASPTHPPYSLVLLQKLLCNSVYLQVAAHLHSSVPKLPKNAEEVSSCLQQFSVNTGVPKIKLRLIWKEVGPQMELIVSSTPIMGEINALRYLSRVIPSLDYESNKNPHQIDEILETAYSIIYSKTKTERASLLQNINKTLGKTNWLCNRPNVTIGDIAVYSAIKQAASSEANVNITKWMQRCENIS